VLGEKLTLQKENLKKNVVQIDLAAYCQGYLIKIIQHEAT